VDGCSHQGLLSFRIAARTRRFPVGPFLAHGLKAMPADLSRPTLGWRVLDLFDEMSIGAKSK
jgi:hypothetical protein